MLGMQYLKLYTFFTFLYQCGKIEIKLVKIDGCWVVIQETAHLPSSLITKYIFTAPL